MRVPLRIIRTRLIAVTDRDSLHVGLAQKVEHDPQTLGSDADEGDVDLIAGRNITHAAQHAAGNNCESNRGRCSLSQELAP